MVTFLKSILIGFLGFILILILYYRLAKIFKWELPPEDALNEPREVLKDWRAEQIEGGEALSKISKGLWKYFIGSFTFLLFRRFYVLFFWFIFILILWFSPGIYLYLLYGGFWLLILRSIGIPLELIYGLIQGFIIKKKLQYSKRKFYLRWLARSLIYLMASIVAIGFLYHFIGESGIEREDIRESSEYLAQRIDYFLELREKGIAPDSDVPWKPNKPSPPEKNDAIRKWAIFGMLVFGLGSTLYEWVERRFSPPG